MSGVKDALPEMLSGVADFELSADRMAPRRTTSCPASAVGARHARDFKGIAGSRYGIYAAPDFAFSLMSLPVVEGTVDRLAPDLDVRMVCGGAATAPPLGACLAAG